MDAHAYTRTRACVRACVHTCAEERVTALEERLVALETQWNVDYLQRQLLSGRVLTLERTLERLV